MRRALALLLLAFWASSVWADAARTGARITSQTTTTLVAAKDGQVILIFAGSICVDANGATTGITLQDSGGTNIIGTGVVYVLAPGQCLSLPRTHDLYYNATASGTSLQLVTTVGNGPVQVYLETVQR